MTRTDILDKAKGCINGDRQESYGTPEDNFGTIAEFWKTYISRKHKQYINLTADDVAMMQILLKVARQASGHSKLDNWIDLAGYAACGGEIEYGDYVTEKEVIHGD